MMHSLFKPQTCKPAAVQLGPCRSLGKAGGAVAVRRTLAITICRVTDPTQVPRPRQLRDESTVMRFQPAHQSMINRRLHDRASCLTRQNLNQMLPTEPRIRAPATWKVGHESGKSYLQSVSPESRSRYSRRRSRAKTPPCRL
jgi:hypothetical protein